MEKQEAISILEDVENSLNKENWKDESLRTINQYVKNLKVATNKKIKKLVEKQKKYIEKYGENGRKTVGLNKKIDKELHKIYGS